METSILKQLIKIDTQLQKSNEAGVRFLVQLIRKAGGRVMVTTYRSESVKRKNIKAVWNKNSKNRPLIFSGHSDTVKPASDWMSNPWQPRFKNNKIYGLGASDMKGSLASFITAINRAKQISRPVYMLIDGDEEGSGAGGRLLTKRKISREATVIIGEPSDGKLRLGQKECYDLRIICRGRSRHGSRTDYKMNNKINAIVKLNRVINRLRSYEVSVSNRKNTFYGRSTLSYGVISGGTSVNTVADRATLLINRRLLPGEKMSSDFKRIKNYILQGDPQASIEMVFYGGPYHTAKSEPWVKRMRSILKKATGKKLPIIYRTGWTEASLFSGWGRVLILGPGNLSAIHKPDESIGVAPLKQATALYRQFIENPEL